MRIVIIVAEILNVVSLGMTLLCDYHCNYITGRLGFSVKLCGNVVLLMCYLRFRFYSLRCAVTGKPNPSVVWYHNGDLVMSGDHIRVAHVRDSATLTIDAARASDAGEYICRASNKLGDVETRTIVVTGPENGNLPWIYRLYLLDFLVGLLKQIICLVHLCDTGLN